jgi:hypothetical protein
MILSTWRLDCNTVRPHFKRGGRTSAEFAWQHGVVRLRNEIAISSTIAHEKE